MDVTAVIPLKGFDMAKERLSSRITPRRRAAVAAATAEHVIVTCLAGGLMVRVVTDDPAVAALARHLGAGAVTDPGGGLNAAAAAGIAGHDDWIVVHGDLPLLTAPVIASLAERVARGEWVIAPSRDGGTNALGGHGPFDFAYGVASFHRHLARLADRRPVVFVTAATAIEVDTPHDLAVAAATPGGEWLDSLLS